MCWWRIFLIFLELSWLHNHLWVIHFSNRKIVRFFQLFFSHFPTIWIFPLFPRFSTFNSFPCLNIALLHLKISNSNKNKKRKLFFHLTWFSSFSWVWNKKGEKGEINLSHMLSSNKLIKIYINIWTKKRISLFKIKKKNIWIDLSSSISWIKNCGS